MAGITVFLCIFVMLLFIMTRKVWLNIILNGGLRLEIHLPILAIYLEKRRDGKNVTREKKKRKKRDRTSFGIIAKHILRLAERSELTVKKLSIPRTSDKYPPREATRIYRYYSVISAFFAYLEGKTQKLTVCDGALDLNSDTEDSLILDMTLKSELFVFLLGFLSFYIDQKRNKFKVR